MISLSALAVLAAALVQHANAVAVWGQCGGIGYSGSTVCDAGSVCTYSNAYYSQCLPGTATTTAPAGGSGTTTTSAPGGGSTAITLNSGMVAKGKKYFGTCADPGTLSATQNAALIKAQFGQVTPENSMKWDATEPSQNSFTFTSADTLVSFATTNNKIIRGHNLLWHSQLPSWVSAITSAATLTSVIQNHATTLVTRYKGKIYGWDVVNEMFNDDGTIRTADVFWTLLKDTYPSIVFKAARAADPTAKLYINDYSLESNTAKRNSLISYVNKWVAAGVPIDGIGTQTHLDAGGAGGVATALTALAATGLEIAITELDIAGAAASDYSTVVKACLAQTKCIGITTWGVRDTDSWRASTTPLLYDGNYQPKAAYTAVISALSS